MVGSSRTALTWSFTFINRRMWRWGRGEALVRWVIMRLMVTLADSGGEVQSWSSRATVSTAMPSSLQVWAPFSILASKSGEENRAQRNRRSKRPHSHMLTAFTHANCIHTCWLHSHMLTAPFRGKINMTGSHSTPPETKRPGFRVISQPSLTVCYSAIPTFPWVSGCSKEKTRGDDAKVVKKNAALIVCMCICAIFCCSIFKFNISFIYWLYLGQWWASNVAPGSHLSANSLRFSNEI